MTSPGTPTPRPDSLGYFASHWRSLDYFNLYRLTLALALVFIGILFDTPELFPGGHGQYFGLYAFAYLFSAALFVLGIRARWPNFQVQLSAHIVADIFFVILMMSASESLANGLGLLLVISIASGGLVGSGRLTLLYASVASIALLLHYAFSILGGVRGPEGLLQAGLLCAGYFLVGALAHTLTQRALKSERLAQQQAEELTWLNRINAIAIENASEGLLVLDPDGTVRHMSPRARSLLRIDAPIHPGTRLEACAPYLAASLPACTQHSGAPATEIRDQSLRIRCIPLTAQEDSRIFMLSDPREADEAAQRLKLAALGRLTANIAHEIRNPLTAISQAAQLLREEAAAPLPARLTDIIDNNARRLDRLVEEVLTLNRRDRLTLIAFDATTLASLIRDIRRTEEIPPEAVIVDMPPSLDFQFDADHLRQIIWNLMRNAWRHSRKTTGSLKIKARLEDKTVMLDMIDDGEGIPLALQSRLFEPFFTTDAQGTGLGLFLARELAEANHATLRYVAGSSGACFRLSIEGQG